MTNKNQHEINDEILNRLHNIQFKSEKLTQSLSFNSNKLFNIENDEKINLLCLKRQYLNEINEAFLNKM